MASFSSGGRGLSFSIGGLVPGRSGASPRAADAPLRLLILADCSGRAAQNVREPLAGRRPRPLDIDRLEDVVRGFNASVALPAGPGSRALVLQPRSLEELHPDFLLEEVPELAELLALREQSEHDAEAARRLRQLVAQAVRAGLEESPQVAPVPPPAQPSAQVAAPEAHEDTLARLLGGSGKASPAAAAPAASAPASKPSPAIDQLVRSLVAGHITPAPAQPALERELTAQADEEIGRRLRALLREPAWRALEATWRGIDGLCRHNPDAERVGMAVLDVSFAELARDPSALARLISAGEADVVLLDHVFGADAAELEVLAQLLATCQASGAALLAGAQPALAGCVSFAELPNPEEREQPLGDAERAAWSRVLALREAGALLGLALPRFLLRQPYGAAGEPLDRLRFEELLDPSDHEAFAWGNGVYLLARALCSRHADGPGVRPDGAVDLRELPVVYLETAEENRVKPSAEAWLSERAVGRLRGAGFCVLQAVRDSDRVIVFPEPALSRA